MSATDDISLDPIVFDLRDADPAVRAQAATVLGLAGNPMVVEYLMQTLAFDESIQVKRSAAIALGNLAHPSGVQPLLIALQAKDDELRTFAAEAIAKINAPEVVDVLLLALQGGVTLQQGALEALSRIGDPRALSALEAMVPSVDARVEALRQSAIAVLGGAAGDPHQALLVELASGDPHARLRALEALASRGVAEFAHVVSALEDPDAHVRAQAATTLGGFGEVVAVEPLTQKLQDVDPLVRTAAALALAELGDPRAIPALNAAIDALSDDSSRAEMLHALGELTKEAVG